MNLHKTINLLFVILGFTSCSPDQEINTSEIENLTTTLENKYAGAQQAIPGEYLVVFHDSYKFKMSQTNDDISKNKEFLKIKGKMKEKALAILSKTQRKEKDIQSIFVNTLQGFAVKNVSLNEVNVLAKNPNIKEVIPNYVYKENLQTHINEENKQSQFYQIPQGDYIHINSKQVGYRDMSRNRNKIFILSNGINRSGFNQVNIDFSKAYSAIRGVHWTNDNLTWGTNFAILMGAKIDGNLSVGIAAGATLVPVKIDNWGATQLIHLLIGNEYTYNNGTSEDVFVYAARNSYNSEPHHPIVESSFANLSTKMKGSISPSYNYQPYDIAQTIPYRLNTPKLWVAGLSTRSFVPDTNAAYGANIDCWAPGVNAAIKIGQNSNHTFYDIPATAACLTAAVLLVRGNNTIGNQGSVTYYGHTAPRLKI